MATKRYIECDGCKFKWKAAKTKLRKVELRLDPSRPDVMFDVTFFKCPKCGKVYIVSVEDDVIRDLKIARDKLVEEHNKLENSGDWKQADYIYNGVKIRNKQIQTQLVRLTNMYKDSSTLLQKLK